MKSVAEKELWKPSEAAPQYAVEKNVPIPKGHSEHHTQYPFPEMNIGDSFLGNLSAANSAYVWGRRHSRKFVTRRVSDGYRIWRVE